jgi:hypothetical protein
VGAEALKGDQRAEQHKAGAEQLPVTGWVAETEAQRGDPSRALIWIGCAGQGVVTVPLAL